jgi:hypothetical protein
MKKGLLIGILFLLMLTGCTSTPVVVQDVPQYKADQVIYVVQAKYPDCTRKTSTQTLQANTMVSVTYAGNKVWKAIVTCPTGYSILGYPTVVYFYETNGSLWRGYNSETHTLSSPY